MKVRTLKRTICLWLCIVLIFTMFSVSFGEEKTGLEESKETNYEILPIPEVMEDTESIEMAVRIDTDEDALNEIKYYYGGDSIVSFPFPTNVKYVGSDNKTRDKSNKLSEAEDYFTNENIDISLDDFFPLTTAVSSSELILIF